MSDPNAPAAYPLTEALRALTALRNLAGLPPETFPIQAFVGMISDEVETLRGQGHTDDEIARTIQEHSSIRITAQEIAENYALPEERHPPHE